jgi:uncharacterized protein YjbI with pentapeptide repeats
MEKGQLDLAVLTAANLRGANVQESSLAGATLDLVEAGKARFSGSQLRGASARQAKFPDATFKAGDLQGVDLTQSKLPRSDFSFADLNGAVLTDVDAKGANFNLADLRGAVLDGGDFRGADFTGASLDGASLLGAKLPNLRNTFRHQGATVVNGRGRVIELSDFNDLPSRVAKKEGRFAQWIGRDRTGEGPAAITRPAVKP